MANLITDKVFGIGNGEAVSLPGLFAAMSREEVAQFPPLRAHQRAAWHMFLVQLGALAVWRAGRRDLPRQAGPWTDALRGLAPEFPGDAPWRLVAPEPDLPGFLQAPDPGGLRWKTVETPDALDMLNTARNHDVKRGVNRNARPEDWILALVSLQTMGGYAGSGQYGIARMNGGYASRSLVGLAPAGSGDMSLDASRWWARDVRRLLAEREAGAPARRGTVGGPALLWCLDWVEGEQLDLEKLDPWFIEVCRRVRLDDAGDGTVARTSSSKAMRIDARRFKGDLGDPWAPVHKTERKSLTIGEGQFDYARLCNLLFSGEWELPVLARRGDEEVGRGMVLVAEALSRGQGRTDGFKSRVMPMPDSVPQGVSAAAKAWAQVEEAMVFQQALGYALAVAAAGGDWEAVGKSHYAQGAAAGNRLNDMVDRLFFPHLLRRLENESAQVDFLEALWEATQAELEAGLGEISCAGPRKEKAHARAKRVLGNRVWRRYPDLYERLRATPMAGNYGTAALSAAGMLRHLGRKELAELRGMESDRAAPAFCRLASRHPGTIGRRAHEREWIAIVRVLAILTPHGGAELHNGSRQLGEVLCDGGDRGWPRGMRAPRPVFGERWLAQFMKARGARRAALLERAARVLSRTVVAGGGVNVMDMAHVLLMPERYGQFLAGPYYRRLDGAAQAAGSDGEEGP